MKTLKTLALFASAMLLTGAAGFAKDEPYLRADHKMLGHQVESSQRHAQEQAQTLYYYSQSQQPVQKQQAMEMVEAVRRDLATANKALETLKAEVAKNKEAVDLIESIKKHHARAHEQCGMAEEACTKEPGDQVTIGDCCSEMYHELDAAKAETQKLLKTLKIEKLEPPKKVTAKPGSPKKTDAKK